MEIPHWKPAGRRYLLLFLLLALALGGAGWYVLQETPEPELVLTVEETGGEHREQAGASGQIEVYISGAVKKPGVYDVPAGSRVYDLVRAAGDDLRGLVKNVKISAVSGQMLVGDLV